MNEYQYKNSYRLGASELAEINRGRFIKGYIWSAVLILLFGVLSFYGYMKGWADFLNSTWGFFAMLLLFAAVIFSQENASRRFSKNNIARYGCDLEMCLSFGEDILLENKTENIEQHYAYGDIRSAYETKHFIVLMTAGKLQIAIKKDGFTEGSLEDFSEYLKRKQEI